MNIQTEAKYTELWIFILQFMNIQNKYLFGFMNIDES